jgi:hypothetical protein
VNERRNALNVKTKRLQHQNKDAQGAKIMFLIAETKVVRAICFFYRRR